MARARTLMCPYCCSRYPTSVAAFRCTRREATRCAPVPDPGLGLVGDEKAPLAPRVVERRARLGQAFKVRSGKPVRCECGAPTEPVCPRCHSSLPQRFSEAASRSMALIGTRAAGKTNYVTVALHELQHRVGARFDATLTLLDDATRQRLEKELKPRLYDAGLVLLQTQSAVSDREVRTPLVSRLTLGRDAASSSNLVFFDAAGEDLEHVSVIGREARYITQTDGLILLIDPLQVPAVRDELAGSVELPPEPVDVVTMLGRVTGLLREARAIPAGRKIDVPLALTVSKLDAIRPLLPPTHPALAAPPHDGAFDSALAATISETLRSDLAGWVGEGLDRLVRQEFATSAYFGVSALGSSPVGDRLPFGVAPHRVEDPILWLLDTWGAVPRR